MGPWIISFCTFLFYSVLKFDGSDRIDIYTSLLTIKFSMHATKYTRITKIKCDHWTCNVIIISSIVIVITFVSWVNNVTPTVCVDYLTRNNMDIQESIDAGSVMVSQPLLRSATVGLLSSTGRLQNEHSCWKRVIFSEILYSKPVGHFQNTLTKIIWLSDTFWLNNNRLK